MRNIPLSEAYYAYCSNFETHAAHPQLGRVIVGTQSEIESELDRPYKERMPSWNAVASSGYGGIAKPEHQKLVMYANFIALIVRDRVDPKVAHEAFLVIPEYRTHLAEDVPGVAAYDG